MGYRPPFLIVEKLAGAVKIRPPQTTSGDDLYIYSNTTDTYPYIRMYGNGKIFLDSGGDIQLSKSGTPYGKFVYENNGGILFLLETTTPTAITNYGAIYTKNDNKLYFQDGAGTEHTIAFV